MKVSITVNGVQHEKDVEPRTLLAYFLREQCGLTDNPIPLPGTPGRYCDHYQQKECGCSNCIPIGV